MTRHRVEAFIDETLVGRRTYGWQCFTCKRETTGLATLTEAKQGRAEHEAGDPQ